MATSNSSACKLEHCNEPSRSLGFCKAHYLRHYKHGDPLSRDEKIALGMIPAPETECSVDGCENKRIAKGMCSKHYSNVRSSGYPTARRDWTVEEVVDRTGWTITASGCWEWQGPLTEYGYGVVTVERSGVKGARVHRIMHERFVGEIPEGMVVRHKCDNPPCVNPDHLEVGTPYDNTQDMVGRGRHGNSKKTHCRRGHDLNDPANVYLSPRAGGRTARVCRACKRSRARK